MTVIHVNGVWADSALDALITPTPIGVSTCEALELADSFIEVHFAEELTDEQIASITIIIQNHSLDVTETVGQVITVAIKAAMGIGE